MDQMADNHSSLDGESSRGAGSVCCIVLDLTEKTLVRIAPEPPSLVKKTKFSLSSYMKDEPPASTHVNKKFRFSRNKSANSKKKSEVRTDVHKVQKVESVFAKVRILLKKVKIIHLFAKICCLILSPT